MLLYVCNLLDYKGNTIAMRHLDLFSGIGGFSLAASQVWQDHEPTFCEIDPYCKAVLRNHWPNAKIYSDIKELKGERGEYDIITGGFPCQPFSTAGKRGGTNDDRYLWPEMLRVIREVRPSWVVGENVAGIIEMALEQVCLDLEGIGYEVQAFVIPACAVSAPHRRDRVWIIANSTGGRQRISKQKGGGGGEPKEKAGSRNRNAPNTRGVKLGWVSGFRWEEISTAWQSDWREIAAHLCGVDDGLSPGLDNASKGIKGGYRILSGRQEGETLITETAHRKERLKALGNSIVPQVAVEIFTSIKQSI